MSTRKPRNPTAPTGARPPVARKAAATPAAAPAAKASVAKPPRKVAGPAKPVGAAQAAMPSKTVKPTKPAKAIKPPKVRRKPVRDSFTMPEADFALIATLKARALSARREVKKSELLRAGLHALAMLTTPELVAAIAQLEPVKVGRPKKD